MRKGNWDFAKASLMLLVIFGHVCPAISGDSYKDSWCALTRVTGLFVMPCFFFISGYFQSNIVSFQGLLEKYKKAFFRIGIPLISWGIILIICRITYYLYLYGQVSIIEFIVSVITNICGYYWFLPALLLCILLGSIISLLLNKRFVLGLVLLVISLPVFSFSVIDFVHFSFVWFYYGCGMLFKIIEPKLKYWINHKSLLFFVSTASVICVIIGYFFYPKYTFYVTSNCFFIVNPVFIISRYLLCLLASLCVLYFLFKIYEVFVKSRFVIFFTQTGQDTLFLYCSHVLCLSYILRPLLERWFGLEGLFKNSPFIRYYLFAPIVAILLLDLLYLINNILKKNKTIQMLFMGNKSTSY